ncbi:MAG: hypothetical protein WA421_18090 [Nitrososphaeraceae archaeon]
MVDLLEPKLKLIETSRKSNYTRDLPKIFSIKLMQSQIICPSNSTSNVSLGRQIAYLNSKDRVTTRRFFMPLMDKFKPL